MKDLSSLPKAKGGRSGLLPDAEPRFIQVLVEAWAADHDENKPTALGTKFRHSDAGGCGRAITYTAAGIPASDPMDLSGVWNVGLGSRIHDLWQAALQRRYPDAEIEVKVATVDADGSGHIDAVIQVPHPGDVEQVGPYKTIAYELKTIGGWGYKASIGLAKGDAEGPKTSHLLQAALNGLGCDADEVVVGYLSKEAVSKAIAKSKNLSELERFACEWTFTREQYEPLAVAEAERIAGLLALVEDGTLGRRNVPHDMDRGAEIMEPATGAWVHESSDGTVLAAGKQWTCGYCKFQSICVRTGPGRIPIADAHEAAVALGLTPKEAA